MTSFKRKTRTTVRSRRNDSLYGSASPLPTAHQSRRVVCHQCDSRTHLDNFCDLHRITTNTPLSYQCHDEENRTTAHNTTMYHCLYLLLNLLAAWSAECQDTDLSPHLRISHERTSVWVYFADVARSPLSRLITKFSSSPQSVPLTCSP